MTDPRTYATLDQQGAAWTDGDGGEQEPDDDQEADDAPETTTVRARLVEEIAADQIHGFTVTRRNADVFYVVFSRSTTWDRVDDDVDMDIPVLDLRTAVVDLGADKVRVSDNGIWVPQETGVSEGLTQLLARTTTDLQGNQPDAGPALLSAVEGVEAGDLLAREIEVEQQVEGQYVDRMDSHGGIDPERGWGYGAGPPPEVHPFAERLAEAGLDPDDHLSRLVWGKKEPMDRQPRPVEELTGNYGVEIHPRDSGLVAIDVDYPDEFPRSDLPETLEVSSPHGDDRRRHILLRCDDKGKIADALGGADQQAWAVQGVDWGDLWVGDRYVVGPGSQLSEFGCDDGDHQRGEPGGCSACEDTEGGFYTVVHDAPIATVEADAVIALLEDSDYKIKTAPATVEEPAEEPDDDDRPTCDSCGAHRDPEDLKTLTVGDDERAICRGGCGE